MKINPFTRAKIMTTFWTFGLFSHRYGCSKFSIDQVVKYNQFQEENNEKNRSEDQIDRICSNFTVHISGSGLWWIQWMVQLLSVLEVDSQDASYPARH